MPSVPSFEGSRLATLEDLPRIATVAAAGFFHSPTFQFQRIYYADYPNDTLSSYWMEYRAAILDPACVVLVAEDLLKEDEGGHVYSALQKATAYSPGAGPVGVKVVVGVASINLKPGSAYIGRFQTRCVVGPKTQTSRSAPENLNRDQCDISLRQYNETTAPAKTRYLAGQMRLSTLAVHPAYWRRGIATRLLGFCTRLADLEGVLVGISAVPMGAAIAAKAGFEERELVRVKRLHPHSESTDNDGDDPGNGDVELWVGIRRPTGSPVSGASATSADSQQ